MSTSNKCVSKYVQRKELTHLTLTQVSIHKGICTYRILQFVLFHLNDIRKNEEDLLKLMRMFCSTKGCLLKKILLHQKNYDLSVWHM